MGLSEPIQVFFSKIGNILADLSQTRDRSPVPNFFSEGRIENHPGNIEEAILWIVLRFKVRLEAVVAPVGEFSKRHGVGCTASAVDYSLLFVVCCLLLVVELFLDEGK